MLSKLKQVSIILLIHNLQRCFQHQGRSMSDVSWKLANEVKLWRPCLVALSSFWRKAKVSGLWLAIMWNWWPSNMYWNYITPWRTSWRSFVLFNHNRGCQIYLRLNNFLRQQQNQKRRHKDSSTSLAGCAKIVWWINTCLEYLKAWIQPSLHIIGVCHSLRCL